MLQLHHLDGSAVAAADFGAQALAEDRHVFVTRSANVRRKVAVSIAVMAARSKQNQVGKLASCEPRESAAVG
jgi:hypothetical protein